MALAVKGLFNSIKKIDLILVEKCRVFIDGTLYSVIAFFNVSRISFLAL
jgi:hypothetical protein